MKILNLLHTEENNRLVDSGTITPMLKRIQYQELAIRDCLERMKERFLLALLTNGTKIHAYL
jgi:hypothetical protein